MTQLLKCFAVLVMLAVAPLTHAQEWRQFFEPKTTEFSNATSLLGQVRQQGESEDRWTIIMFGVVVKKDGQTAAGYTIDNTYFDKPIRKWTSATTSEAEELKLDVLARESRCKSRLCFIDESVRVLLPIETLRKAAKEDMRIRLTSSGRRGEEFIFAIDRNEAQALLNGLAELAGPSQK